MQVAIKPKPVLIVQNIGRERAGHIETMLGKHMLPSETIHIGGMSKDISPSSYRAVIVLGGPASANDTNEKMLSELDFVRRAVEEGIPYLGICLGMQVLVKATGGVVRKNKVKEIGFRSSRNGEPYVVILTPEGKASPLFVGLPDIFPVFQLHGETVDVAVGQKILATGKDCHIQAVQAGERAFGIQFHPELTESMLGVWTGEDSDLCALQPPVSAEDVRYFKTNVQPLGLMIVENFVRLIKC